MDRLPRYAISVRQPWAWALIHGGKHLENRTPHALRFMHAVAKPPMKLCIHASLGMTRDEYESALYTFREAGLKEWPRPDELVRGGVIGTVQYTHTIRESTSPWWCGPSALVFEEPLAVEPVIPCGGQLGFFEWRKSAEYCEAHGTTVEAPKPWMLAWPDDLKPRRVNPAGVQIAPEPAPLLDLVQSGSASAPAAEDNDLA